MSWQNIDNNMDDNENENENKNIDVCDCFEMMIREISRFKDQYHSFTTDKTYTDLLGKTASGLLKDAAAETAELSLEQRKKHEYSLNVFSAFCMYFCVTKIEAYFGEKIARSLAGDAVNTVYERILKRIRRDLEKTGESHFVRNLIKRSAVNAMKDILEKNNSGSTVGFDESEYAENDDEFDEIDDELAEELTDGILGTIQQSERLTALERAINKAAKEKILTKKELLAICHFFGYGNGFKKLSNHAIAQKLGCSDAQASRLRKNACIKLYHFLRETPEFNEIFF